MDKEKEFRTERSMPKEAVACIECHKKEQPGLFIDWTHSRHARANVTCHDCHKADKTRIQAQLGVGRINTNGSKGSCGRRYC